ncbi:hypothetical protein LINPERHAP2_LOCUS22726, partial [Linum perenne]
MCAGAHLEVPGALFEFFSKLSAEYSKCAPFGGQSAPAHILTFQAHISCLKRLNCTGIRNSSLIFPKFVFLTNQKPHSFK